MKIAILFKNGTEIECECLECTTKYNRMNGDLVNILTEGDTRNHLLYVCLNDVSAIYQKGEIENEY